MYLNNPIHIYVSADDPEAIAEAKAAAEAKEVAASVNASLNAEEPKVESAEAPQVEAVEVPQEEPKVEVMEAPVAEPVGEVCGDEHVELEEKAEESTAEAEVEKAEEEKSEEPVAEAEPETEEVAKTDDTEPEVESEEPVAEEEKSEEPVAEEEKPEEPVAEEEKSEEPVAEAEQEESEEEKPVTEAEPETEPETETEPEVKSEEPVAEEEKTEEPVAEEKVEEPETETVKSEEEKSEEPEPEVVSAGPDQDKFVSFLSDGDVVLNFDHKNKDFKNQLIAGGCTVVDATSSATMCKMAGEFTGVSVQNLIFRELREKEKYNAIYGGDSIMHLNENQLPGMFDLLASTLKADGVLYMEFIYGVGEDSIDGVFCTRMSEDRLEKLMYRVTSLVADEVYATGEGADKRLHVILKK